MVDLRYNHRQVLVSSGSECGAPHIYKAPWQIAMCISVYNTCTLLLSKNISCRS